MNNFDNLQFSTLLEKVISMWPDIIDTSLIAPNQSNPELYEITGLYEISEKIADLLENEHLAILLVPLSDTISFIARSASLHLTQVAPKKLRSDTIREKFEERLQYIIGEPKLGWLPGELKIARQYLDQQSH